jgi:hypothetical protein
VFDAKKMYNKIKTPVCPACQPQEESEFDIIRATLRDNPDMNIQGISKISGVDEDVIQRMLKEGLISSAALNESAKCGMCGKPAISAAKKLCQPCLDKLNTEVTKAQGNVRLTGKKDAQVGEFLNVRQTLSDKRKG